MQRYFISLSYNGSSFHGWQVQENALTVQQEIEHCLKLLINQEINLHGCGRTDSGVHARYFVAHFDSKKKFKQDEIAELIRKLNLFLPESIIIQEIIPVHKDAHARFDAEMRTYKYFISRTKNPFLSKYSYYYHGPLNIRLMNLAAQTLKQYTDFTTFAKTGGNSKTNECNIFFAEWDIDKESQLMVFTITANRFLRNMVRSIVGTLLEVGKEKMTIEEFRAIVQQKRRSLAGASMDAKGLFLWDVQYPHIELKKNYIRTGMEVYKIQTLE